MVSYPEHSIKGAPQQLTLLRGTLRICVQESLRNHIQFTVQQNQILQAAFAAQPGNYYTKSNNESCSSSQLSWCAG